MEQSEILNKILNEGVTLTTSGTTGTPKEFFHSPDKLRDANRAAIDSQELTANSRVYTVCKMQHAGGLLAQTLPAHSIGATVVVEQFNAYTWVREIRKYTHSHITPLHGQAIQSTKGFSTLDLTGVWITCGSDPVEWSLIEAFVNRGATFMANWGMTEIGPCAINATFRNKEDLQQAQLRKLSEPKTLLGNTYYCDYKIVNGELHVKGDISVFGDTWYATGDLVATNMLGEMYYAGRKL